MFQKMELLAAFMQSSRSGSFGISNFQSSDAHLCCYAWLRLRDYRYNWTYFSLTDLKGHKAVLMPLLRITLSLQAFLLDFYLFYFFLIANTLLACFLILSIFFFYCSFHILNSHLLNPKWIVAMKISSLSFRNQSH